ncbi:MAG: hypothetical protein LBC35_01605 [Coriobacteriales bacterium]|jgi:hypothetical protein|nr:hypothetical protein [Coriobacteriales bacterium]
MAKSLRQKDINFLAVLDGRRAKRALSPQSFILPGVLVLVVLVGLGVFTFFQVNTMRLNSESDQIQTYLSSATTARELSEAQALKTQATDMQAKASNVATPMDNLASYPELTLGILYSLIELAGANIEITDMQYTKTTGILHFTASSDYVLSIPTFVSQLRTSGLFAYVEYTGYSGGGAGGGGQLADSTNRGSSTDTTGTSGATGAGAGAAAAAVSEQTPTYKFSLECALIPPPAPTSSGTPAAVQPSSQTGGE